MTNSHSPVSKISLYGCGGSVEFPHFMGRARLLSTVHVRGGGFCTVIPSRLHPVVHTNWLQDFVLRQHIVV